MNAAKLKSFSMCSCMLHQSRENSQTGYLRLSADSKLFVRQTRRPYRIECCIGSNRLRVDAHLDHSGLAGGEAAIEGGAELRGLLDDLAHRAEGSRERGELRVLDIGRDHAPRIVLLLVHADRSVDAVVHHHEDHR